MEAAHGVLRGIVAESRSFQEEYQRTLEQGRPDPAA